MVKKEIVSVNLLYRYEEKVFDVYIIVHRLCEARVGANESD